MAFTPMLSTSATAKLYETDLVQWADETAELLRQGRMSELDIENLIEEVEDLAGRHRDALESQLTRLLMHLLKWKYQPQKRSGSWAGSIRESRKQIRRLIRKYPSLKNHLTKEFDVCYEDAVEDASDETGLASKAFPVKCEWTVADVFDKEFLPS
ncbi:MAG: DUF29 domain-containing protein [Cyanobacteria bacterium P01_A01_bin.17]